MNVYDRERQEAAQRKADLFQGPRRFHCHAGDGPVVIIAASDEAEAQARYNELTGTISSRYPSVREVEPAQAVDLDQVERLI